MAPSFPSGAVPVAVVTGSTRGIGRGIVEALLGEGWRVVVNSRSADVAAQVARKLGPEAIGIGADVSSDEGAGRLVSVTLEAFGRIDALVNNAGVSMVEDSLQVDAAAWRRHLDVNLTGPFLCSQAAGAAMLAAGGGAIVNVASMLAVTGMPRRAAYSASKAGVVALTRVLALEWAPAIRVNAIAPGYVRTDLFDHLVASGRVDSERIRARTPADRVAEVVDIADAVRYLLSDKSRFITGQTLVVDGGWSINGGA